MPIGPMEAYERQTGRVIKRFLSRKLSFPGCIAALDAALAALIPELSGEQIEHLRALMLANNETVMKEMEKRKSLHEAP
jgi:hypothetical protein